MMLKKVVAIWVQKVERFPSMRSACRSWLPRSVGGFTSSLVSVLFGAALVVTVHSPNLRAADAPGTTLRVDLGLGEQSRMNSIARLLAGMPPLTPAHLEMAKSEGWKAHSEDMQAIWRKLSSGRVAAMSSWRNSAIAGSCTSGKTLLYPFSGPDFFNAWWLFPDCENFLMFGLEYPGEAPNIDALNDKQLTQLLSDVRAAMEDFVHRNYFITSRMSRQLATAHLRGIVPLVMISMAISGVDILRVVPLKLASEVPQDAEGKPAVKFTGRSMRPTLSGVTIEFRVPGATLVRKVHYFAADATDAGLQRYPELLTFLKSFGTTTTFIKSASYLLHAPEFNRMRETVLDVTGFLVQDDTGVPYSVLASRGWKISLHGRYGVPIPPFQRAYQSALAKAYREQSPEVLPFTFGYQYHDSRDQRSNAMVGRRPIRDPRQGAAAGQADDSARLARLGRH